MQTSNIHPTLKHPSPSFPTWCVFLWKDLFDISTFRYSIFRHFDILTLLYSHISICRHFDIPTFRYSDISCWHKVNRNFTLKARSSTSTEEDKTFTRVVEKWLYSFSKTDIETREEEAYSMQQIEYFISHSGISEPLKCFTQEYWVKVSNYDSWTFRSFDVSIFR